MYVIQESETPQFLHISSFILVGKKIPWKYIATSFSRLLFWQLIAHSGFHKQYSKNA